MNCTECGIDEEETGVHHTWCEGITNGCIAVCDPCRMKLIMKGLWIISDPPSEDWEFDKCKTCYDYELQKVIDDTIIVEMNVVRDAMTTWTGNVPKELFNSDNPKRAIAQWLWDNGTCSEVDFDNIIIDSFDYDRDAVDGTDVKGDY
jgi:hypothetical protein